MIGFIGLGHMGEPIARRLAASGSQVAVFDRRVESADRCLDEGASWLTPVEMAACCETAMICVATFEQVSVVLDTLLEALPEHGRLSTIVVLSTITPSQMLLLAGLAQPRGISMVDAPISGSDEARENGQLTLMLGGDRETIDRLRPDFSRFASSIFFAGPVGSGQATKLANNILALCGLLAVVDALAMASAYDVDEDILRAAISVSTGDTYALRHLEFWRSLKREHPQGDSPDFVKFMQKDLRSALAAAGDAGIQLHLVPAAIAAMPESLRELWPESWPLPPTAVEGQTGHD